MSLTNFNISMKANQLYTKSQIQKKKEQPEQQQFVKIN